MSSNFSHRMAWPSPRCHHMMHRASQASFPQTCMEPDGTWGFVSSSVVRLKLLDGNGDHYCVRSEPTICSRRRSGASAPSESFLR